MHDPTSKESRYRIRVLLFAEYRIVLESLEHLINSSPHMSVSAGLSPGLSDDSDVARNAALSDVAVLYLSDGGQVRIVSQLLEINPAMRVIVVADGSDTESQAGAVRGGRRDRPARSEPQIPDRSRPADPPGRNLAQSEPFPPDTRERPARRETAGERPPRPRPGRVDRPGTSGPPVDRRRAQQQGPRETPPHQRRHRPPPPQLRLQQNGRGRPRQRAHPSLRKGVVKLCEITHH